MFNRSADPDDALAVVSLGVTSWRRYGAALVPLALAGLLPPWATASLCLIFALGAAFTKWHEARLVLALLVLIVVIVPPFIAAFSQVSSLGHTMEVLLWQYGVLALALFLCYSGLSTLENGQRRGLFYGLLPGLLAPQPALILALAGGALLRPGLEDHLPRPRQIASAELKLSQRVWLWLGAGVLSLTLLATFLPRYTPHLPVATQTQEVPQNPPPPDTAQRPVPPAAGSSPRVRTEYRARLPMPPTELMMGLVALSMLLFLINLIRVKPDKGEPWKVRFYELLLLVVIALNVLLVLVLSLLARRANAANQLPPASAAQGPVEVAPQAEKTVQVTSTLLDGLAVAEWIFFALLLGLLAFLAWSLFVRPERATVGRDAAALAEDADTPSADEALHRIRVAYRDAEDALTLAGRARHPSESPQAYAARLSAQQPDVAESLRSLTQLYLPVRYGGQASNDQAANAEQHSQAIIQLAAQWPPLTDPKETHD